jgi:hypothetical protein
MTKHVVGLGSWAGVPVGRRKTYDLSHVVTPYVAKLAPAGSIAALRVFSRYQPMEPVVWRRAGRAIYWNTLKSDTLEHELLALARRRTRGIRQSIATLARWTGSTPDSVSRALRALVKRGAGMLEVGKGRYAVAVFRAVGAVNAATNSARAAGLTDEQVSERYMARYTDEEQAKLHADAYAFRSGLMLSLAAVGYDDPDQYLADMAALA